MHACLRLCLFAFVVGVVCVLSLHVCLESRLRDLLCVCERLCV